MELIVWRDTPIASASWPWARSRPVRNARTLFFIAALCRPDATTQPGTPRPRGAHRRYLPGRVATITAGSQPTDRIGVQLPCLTARAIVLPPTNRAASAVIT